jgi:hypothetical protein
MDGIDILPSRCEQIFLADIFTLQSVVEVHVSFSFSSCHRHLRRCWDRFGSLSVCMLVQWLRGSWRERSTCSLDVMLRHNRQTCVSMDFKDSDTKTAGERHNARGQQSRGEQHDRTRTAGGATRPQDSTTHQIVLIQRHVPTNTAQQWTNPQRNVGCLMTFKWPRQTKPADVSWFQKKVRAHLHIAVQLPSKV